VNKKQKKERAPITVRIKKLKANYEIRYEYSKLLTEYIKTFPIEHRRTRVDNVVMPDGSTKEDWVRIVRDVQIGNLIVFLIDNGMEFVLENITASELQEIKKEYRARQERIKQALRLKEESLDVKGEDYSFMKLQPYEYQKKAIKFFEINDGVAILGDQPGVGKSLSAFAYATKHRKKALVICPASLKLMWKDEIAKFTNEKAHLFKYWPNKRSKEVNHSKDESLFHVINYEGLSSFIKLEYKHVCQGNKLDPVTKQMKRCNADIINLSKTMKECPICSGKKTFKTRIHGVEYFKTKEGEYLDPSDYELIIIDEFHRMKNPKTDWTQVIKRSFAEIPRKLLLSGTAIKSRPIELFVPLNFLDPKTWNDRHAFGLRYCAAYEDNFGWIYDGVSNTEELYNRIAPIYLRRLKKDVLPELPPKTFTEIRVELDPSELREYTKLETATKKVVDSTGDIGEGEKEVPKTFMEKIHQIKLFTETVKLDRATELIKDVIDSKDKIVLFFDYLPTAQRIKDLFGDRAVIHTGSMKETEKHDAVKKFQNDKSVNVFGGTIMSAGVGITLTSANKLLFLGQAWTPADMEQAEDRIHRASTKHDNVQIITLLCDDTIDGYIYDFLRKKHQVVSKVLDNVDSSRKSVEMSGNLLNMLYEKLSA
jgi:SWI/SNF-related matrix-associated actin-dependent regulator 1 of chromatin subfamily A